MSDIIHLLPDSVANQIAAGEVIQRPSSAAKEMLENAVDSGADDIKLVIKNAGKTLVQVIDNGCGMSETDARMSFERHATSKIREAKDLFAIRTLGFRGEALASIAAIAQVEMKTRRHADEMGTLLQLEGSQVVKQETLATSTGTSIAVKNLFYNIPARRKFLKSNTTELRHIIEEFQRIALVQPDIRFTLYNDGKQLFQLAPGKLKQRIVALFGPAFNNRLIPVEQKTEVLSISGFIGKPEFARKTRGEQYFFVNDRYIKHAYLNHALEQAFYELIPSDAYPTYFLYFNISPSEIDINIHPTKTEINFQNNKVIYAMLNSAVRQSLGKFNIIPSLDFRSETSFEPATPPKGKPVRFPEVRVNPGYNPFRDEGVTLPHSSATPPELKREDLSFEKHPGEEPFHTSTSNSNKEYKSDDKQIDKEIFFQLQSDFLISPVKSGLIVIHRQRALERIFFEDCLDSLKSGKGMSQQHLFPQTIQMSAQDAEILQEIRNDLRLLGFEIEDFGHHTFIIRGTPVELNNTHIKDVLDSIVEHVKQNRGEVSIDKHINLARSMAVNMAYRHKKKLFAEEVKSLIDRLFATKVPETSPDGKPVVQLITSEEIRQKF